MALATQFRVQTIKGKFERFSEPTNYSRTKKLDKCPRKERSTAIRDVSERSLNNSPFKSSRDAFVNNEKNTEIPDSETYPDEQYRMPNGKKEPIQNATDDSRENRRALKEQTTFAEKQKLVENIVMNIKNCKQPSEERTIKPKNGLSNLFDMEMKDVFEKGVRRFSVGKKETQLDSKKQSRTSDIFNDHTEQNYVDLKRTNNETNQLNDMIKTNVSAKKKHTISNGFKDSDNYYENCTFPEPRRPPRKRTTKKNQAPSPPSPMIIERDIKQSNVERSSDEDAFPSYCRDPFYSKPERGRSPSRRHYKPTTEKVGPVLPEGPPPQKPPRTFAHDIYRQGKPFGIERYSPNPHTQCIYTKPLKRTKPRESQESKEKSVSFIEPGKSPKPQVAPKPLHLSSHKRFSVIEPMESLPLEFPDKKVSVKRNSSFRFSFRKSKRPSPSPTRLSHVSKLRQIARSWTRLKAPEEKPNKRSKSEEYLYKTPLRQTRDPIYDTPGDVRKKKPGVEELHYMVSPLFPGTDNETRQTSFEISRSPQQTEKSKKSWGGMKNEFRQSCRNVQRKLKAVR